MKTIVTILLLCSLCLKVRAQEQVTEPFDLLSTKGHESDFSMTECLVGLSFLAAGGVIVVKLIDFCKKHFGTNQPAMTNTHQIIRSENLADWKLVGKMTWDDKKETWEYQETNSMSEAAHFYRITNYFGQ